MNQHKLNIILCGTGTVGGTLLGQIADQQDYLLNERNLDLKVVGVVDIFNILTAKEGINLSQYKCDGSFSLDAFREAFKAEPKSSLEVIKNETIKMKQTLEAEGMLGDGIVFVDCTAAYDVAALYQGFIDEGISITCANKVAASGDYDAFMKLKKTAVQNDVKYKYETNVGAGLPVIRTIDHLVSSGDKVTKIEAILSGTLNFIFNVISENVTFSQAVLKAKEERFSEPDPRVDLSGVDVIRKLVILARESGMKVSQDDVEKHLFVPDEYFEGSLDDFWTNLPKLDAHFEQLRQDVEANHEHLRFVAKFEDGKCSVSLERVDEHHPFYDLEGSNNIVMIHTERYCPHPMIVRGYGAGAGVTAAGVFADIMDIANI